MPDPGATDPSAVSMLTTLIVAALGFVGVFRLVSRVFEWLSRMLRTGEDVVARGVMVAMAWLIPAMAIGVVVLDGLVGPR
jgi:hypothetical protein